MPKQKTHKGTKKRFRLTANGKVKHRSAGTSHLAARKTQKRIRQLRGTTSLAAGMVEAHHEGAGGEQLLDRPASRRRIDSTVNDAG